MSKDPPPGWTLGTTLARTVRRADFLDALAFVTEVSRLAEADDHHPDIDIRFRNVTLSLCTHSQGHQVTGKDFALAEKINAIDEASVLAIREEFRHRFSSSPSLPPS